MLRGVLIAGVSLGIAALVIGAAVGLFLAGVNSLSPYPPDNGTYYIGDY